MSLRARTALAAATLLAAACQVERRLVVTSDPPGATCQLDGVQLGTTPLRIPFEHYGQRRVSLYLDGYLTDSQVVPLEPPWYGYFPFDIVSEVLLPFGWSDVHRVHVVLEPGLDTIPEPDLKSVLERAETLRRAGPEGPLPMPVPPAEPPPGEPPSSGAGFR